jgi:hypothetical protein
LFKADNRVAYITLMDHGLPCLELVVKVVMVYELACSGIQNSLGRIQNSRGEEFKIVCMNSNCPLGIQNSGGNSKFSTWNSKWHRKGVNSKW